jgi:DNA-binding MarR family transcriptional regulator
MPDTLREEIQQKRPFASRKEEAALNIGRTAAVLTDAFDREVKPWGITSAQYNVLRILRGAEPKGLCRNDVRDRMVTRAPDMTRLLDRMEESGLVARTRDTEDRRMVTTRITGKGLHMLTELDSVVAEQHQRHFGHLSDAQLETLIALLTLVRSHR